MDLGPATGTPLIIGSVVEGQILTVDVAPVSDPDGINAIGYLWQRSTDGGVNFTDISPFAGADPHYTVQAADVGAVLRVGVAVQDSQGNISGVLSASSAIVTSGNNEPTGAVVISGTPLIGETLTADTSTIDDVDGLGAFTYSWVRLKEGNSTVVSTTDTYTLTADDAHARFKVIVTYQDGASFTEDVESALSASIPSGDDDVPPPIEFRFGDNRIDENEFGGFVGELLFDGIDSPSLTYSIVADATGLFELTGHGLRITAGAALDFEAAAIHLIEINVTDGAGLDYTETVTVAVVDRNANPGLAAHPPPADPVVAADIAGLVFPGSGRPLNSPQWLNENQIEVTFATTRQAYDFALLDGFARPFSDTEKDVARGIPARACRVSRRSNSSMSVRFSAIPRRRSTWPSAL